MAYGNWGAWVFRNGTHMPTHEDQTPYDEETRTAGYDQAFSRSTTGADPHHAVLGGRSIRLCGYKATPVLYVAGVKVELDPYKLEREPGGEEWEETYEGTIPTDEGAYRFRAEQHNGNMVDLILLEPDGTEWWSRCGYGYGAGIDDTPRDQCSTKLGDPG